MAYSGQWHGEDRYFGLHYDFHANEKDGEIGTCCGPAELIPMLKLMSPDFVQTDCKGHAGYTSWFSRAPNASVSPGVVKDALQQWRAATRRLRLPLHCHYSGIWDKAAASKHPEWAARGPEAPPAGELSGAGVARPPAEKMCPRGPYLDELMIPQMMELIDRYGVDGFWVDGDIWAVEPCYCEQCRRAFAERTGIAEPPTCESDPVWPVWWNFTRESFEEYVARYVEAVHRHKPGVLVCSNWLQTLAHPGEPKVPTDWVSGDNTHVWGMDASRCEARFLSTRGKPWDIMLWSFYCSHGMGGARSPWVAKPAEMLEQEAAVILAFGGQVQIYENPGLRNGQLVPWRMKRLGRVGRFVRRRRAVCQGTETIPQVAVLHSEYHIRSTVRGRNLYWGADTAPVRGAVFALIENHYGVDILDEWALLPRWREFPVIVAPEQDAMSQTMVGALKEYVERGGRLLVSGAKSWERLGGHFLGVTAGKLEPARAYHVPAADGAAPLYSDPWRLVELSGARSLGHLGTSPLLDERLLPHPAATLHKVGRGAVAYIPGNVFRDFNHNRYPLTRSFVGAVMKALAGRMDIEAKAPMGVDVVLRRKGGRRIVHMINRCSGIPNQPHNGAIAEVPEVGPIQVRMKLERRPRKVRMALENTQLVWKYRKFGLGGVLTAEIPRFRIHAALVIIPG